MTLIYGQVEVYNYSDFTSDDEHLIIDLSSNNQGNTETTVFDQTSIPQSERVEEDANISDNEVVQSVMSQLISQVRSKILFCKAFV